MHAPTLSLSLSLYLTHTHTHKRTHTHTYTHTQTRTHRYWRGRVRKQACRRSRLPHSKKEDDDYVILSCCVFQHTMTLSAEMHLLRDSTTSRHAHLATRQWMCTSKMHCSSLAHAASWICTSKMRCCMCTHKMHFERHPVLMHCREQQRIFDMHRASGCAHVICTDQDSG